MARKLLSLMALACFLCAVPGCGTGGGEAAFEETSAQTQEEIQEAEDYGEMMRKQELENFKKK
ncbi:hypothetical protein [Stieleria sp.]|uniref:Secreted protein n=1 Tax=Stieleria magnilauensis TaxID=2527963 RepID=A0ABX5XIA6_9BACT|nr:hypothetical protein TBK1r_06480 [Planctomycetes bacterium TBK1r]